MNENITGRKDWFSGDGDGPIIVILEEEGRRLIETKLSCHNYPLYFIQKSYINPVNGKGYWVDVHYDRSKNKMMRAFRFNTYG